MKPVGFDGAIHDSAHRFRRLKIQRSSSGTARLSETASGRQQFSSLGTHGSTPELSIFMKIRREAFQILFAKARALSMFSTPIAISVPGRRAAHQMPCALHQFHTSPSPPVDR